MNYPKTIPHWVYGNAVYSSETFAKIDPATGRKVADVQRGNAALVDETVKSASRAFEAWARLSWIERGAILKRVISILEMRLEEFAELLSLECGKSKKDARGEVRAAIKCGEFVAGLAKDLGEEVLQSENKNRFIKLVRQSIGVGALLTPFNNPLAGVVWKVFPALLCGNAAVLKAHEYVPFIPIRFAELLQEGGVPAGVFSVLQGFGSDVGLPLVRNSRVKFVSMTGSLRTGQIVRRETADRLAKVSIEAGGKNPFIVCSDADIAWAAECAVQSAFIDGGQRCAAASVILVENNVYEKFRNVFLERAEKITVGTSDAATYGAIISGKRLCEIEEHIQAAIGRGAKAALCGKNLHDPEHGVGYFLTPTILENISSADPIVRTEVFGPVVTLHRFHSFDQAFSIAQGLIYRLSSALHTKDANIQRRFEQEYRTGVIRINGPTHGSEPHMPFGGVGVSGDGWREPGRKALDFYSDWKQVSIDYP